MDSPLLPAEATSGADIVEGPRENPKSAEVILLRRFASYLDRIFGFRPRVDSLRDGRLRPQIPLANVWLCAFAMFVVRLRSFNALEQQLRRAKRWESWAGSRKPSADTLGRVFAQISLPELRQLLVTMNRLAWRNKAIHLRCGEAYRVVALDGHEVGSSRARCCDECLVREVTVRGEKLSEYYHRVVMAQWVGASPPAILDVERVHPGEGEVVAARRLLERIFRDYSRLIDVISADALYLEGPFIEAVLHADKHVVVVMKQEARELYQDAQQLKKLLAPQLIEDGPRTTRLWDLTDLDSFQSLGRAVRVVWVEEQTLKERFRGGKRQQVLEEKTWIWVSDLPAATVPATKIQRWGHDRWDIENRGFNELVTLWHMDHYFVHQPTAIEALLLTLALAFFTTYLFYQRNLKLAARLQLSRLALTTLLIEDFALLDATSLWPSLQPSG